MNPSNVAAFDQAGAGMRECARILTEMAKPLIALGVDPSTAAALALELMQTMLLHADAQRAAAEAVDPEFPNG